MDFKNIDKSIMIKDNFINMHKDFWNGKGILVNTRPKVIKKALRMPLKGIGVFESESIYLTPEQLEPLSFIVPSATDSASVENFPATEGDAFVVKSPIKLPWAEAIMGCPVKLIPSSGAAWAEQYLNSFDGMENLRLKSDNAWLAKLTEFAKIFSEQSGNRYLVSHATMRGPIDIADAMLGTERLFLELLDNPKHMYTLMEICTEAWIKTAQSQLDVIEQFHGGYVSRYGIWAPGRVVRMQTDASAMLSPDVYTKSVLSFDIAAASAFDYSIMHTHSKYLQHIENYLTSKAPSAIQVGIDEPPFGPPVVELLPVIKKILKSKPVIVHGGVSAQEADMLANELPHTGLMLDLFIKG